MSISEEVNLFSSTPVLRQTLRQHSEFVPAHGFDDATNSKVEFPIPANSSAFTSLQFYLHFDAQVIDSDTGLMPAEGVQCAPINLAALTQFRDAILTIGGVRVEGGNGGFHYKSWLTHEFLMSIDAKNSWMEESYVYAKDSGDPDYKSVPNNIGYKKRYFICPLRRAGIG